MILCVRLLFFVPVLAMHSSAASITFRYRRQEGNRATRKAATGDSTAWSRTNHGPEFHFCGGVRRDESFLVVVEVVLCIRHNLLRLHALDHGANQLMPEKRVLARQIPYLISPHKNSQKKHTSAGS